MEEILNLALLLSDDEDEDIDDVIVENLLDNVENIGPRAQLYGRFNLENILEMECVNLLRFSKEHIARLCICLNIPERITTRDRVTVSGKL